MIRDSKPKLQTFRDSFWQFSSLSVSLDRKLRDVVFLSFAGFFLNHYIPSLVVVGGEGGCCIDILKLTFSFFLPIFFFVLFLLLSFLLVANKLTPLNFAVIIFE